MGNLKGSGEENTGGGGKKYRHRLSVLGKAMVFEQIFIIMITNCKNESRAEKSDKGFMVCDDTMHHLLPWFDTNQMMQVHKSYIISFRHILDVVPEGEYLQLKMTDGWLAIVSKGHIKEFRRKYKRYNSLNS